jgi:hypothetical protein
MAWLRASLRIPATTPPGFATFSIAVGRDYAAGLERGVLVLLAGFLHGGERRVCGIAHPVTLQAIDHPSLELVMPRPFVAGSRCC